MVEGEFVEDGRPKSGNPIWELPDIFGFAWYRHALQATLELAELVRLIALTVGLAGGDEAGGGEHPEHEFIEDLVPVPGAFDVCGEFGLTVLNCAEDDETGAG